MKKVYTGRTHLSHLGGLALPESTRCYRIGFHQHHLFEVFTINGASGSYSSQAQWRARLSHEEFVEPGSAIVIGDVVYFKVDTVCDAMICGGVNPGIHFEFLTASIRLTLRGGNGGEFCTGQYMTSFKPTSMMMI